jgi:hypothetical protein
MRGKVSAAHDGPMNQNVTLHDANERIQRLQQDAARHRLHRTIRGRPATRAARWWSKQR